MRNRYVDLLRAVAIVRVVTYHTLGFAWLTVAFPAMGLMFALGGSLMAASLDRGDGLGLKAIGRRIRRIVVPFWVLGAFALVLMSFMGGLEHTWRLVLWFLPLDDPPTSEKGGVWFSQIWYVRSYLWFIILSPVMLWLFRKAPIPAVLVPFGVLVVLWETGHGTGGTRAHYQRVDDDLAAGRAAGVRGTPAFFVNGVPHEGGFDFESLRETLDKVAIG